MSVINIQVRRKQAASPLAHIVCGNAGYKISFHFDDEWADYDIKTARFIWNGKYEDVVFTGNVCDVPVIRDTALVAVGVYAGDLCTTTPALVACDKSILCAGGLPADPSPDVYAQIMDLMNAGYVSAESIKSALGYTPANSAHTHTAAQVGARPNTWTPTANEVGARPATWMPTAADVGALPCDGSSSITGNLTIESSTNKHFEVRNTTSGRVARTQINADYAQLNNMTDNTNYSAIVLGPEAETPTNILRLRVNTSDKGALFYPILHTGNKPSGSYTGNGSAASRTIDVGGIGEAILIYSGYGLAIVTRRAVAIINSSGSHAMVASAAGMYADGKLSLVSTESVLNTNGATYYYQVL